MKMVNLPWTIIVPVLEEDESKHEQSDVEFSKAEIHLTMQCRPLSKRCVQDILFLGNCIL